MRLLLLLVLILPVYVAAQAPEADNWCREGFFTRDSDTFQIGIVKAQRNERVYFYNDAEDDCPMNEKCRAKAYVVAGDRVVTSRTYKDFGCAWFSPAKGAPTIGWIKLTSLNFAEPLPGPPLSAWLGEWSYAENSIKITNNKLAGYVNVVGDALWRGAGDNVHNGQIDDRAEPAANMLKLGENETDEYACKVTMQLIREFLVVNDNMRCGGFNVTFSGVYRRTRRY